MTTQHTERSNDPMGRPAPMVPELLEDVLADLLAGSIEMKQLLWNLGPQATLGLNQLLADLVRDSFRWMDRVAERLWELGVAPSSALVRPVLRPDPTGGRRLDERTAGMIAGHLTGELAQRTRIRAEDERMTDARSRDLLAAMESELALYATLASQPEHLVR
jgi:hypothetical protein